MLYRWRGRFVLYDLYLIDEKGLLEKAVVDEVDRVSNHISRLIKGNLHKDPILGIVNIAACYKELAIIPPFPLPFVYSYLNKHELRKDISRSWSQGLD